MSLLNDILKQFFVESEQMLKDNIKKAGKNVTGKTLSQINTVSVFGDHYLLFVPEYLNVLEKGRKPGKRPPVNEIKTWLQAKGVSDKLDSAAWAVSTSIAKNGTKLYQDGGRDDIITPVLDEKRFDLLVSLFADESLNAAEESILKAVKKHGLTYTKQ